MSTEAMRLEDVAGNDDFRHLVSQLHPLINEMGTALDVPPIAVTVILAEDFVVEVEAAWHRAGIERGDGFTVERVGGQVRAKNVPLKEDDSVVYIVFDGEAWPGQPSVGDILEWHWLVAHELTHPILGRLRHASGVLDGVPFPSFTPREIARSMMRIAVDEFRCDTVADQITKSLVRVEAGGEYQGFGLDEITGGGYGQAFKETLDARIYPGWPDIIDSYRNWQIDLDTMWQRLVQETDQTMTLLAHAEAEAYSRGESPLLEVGGFREHRGVSLYLGPVWGALLDALGSGPLIPNLAKFAAVEQLIGDTGERTLYALWRKLGVTVEDLEDRRFALWVDQPTR